MGPGPVGLGLWALGPGPCRARALGPGPGPIWAHLGTVLIFHHFLKKKYFFLQKSFSHVFDDFRWK